MSKHKSKKTAIDAAPTSEAEATLQAAADRVVAKLRANAADWDDMVTNWEAAHESSVVTLVGIELNQTARLVPPPETDAIKKALAVAIARPAEEEPEDAEEV